MRHWTYRIKHDKDTDEWVVRAFKDGVYNEARTYYALDKDDAVWTAKAMIDSDEEDGELTEA
jgi:uncharacterized membrane protein YkoI